MKRKLTLEERVAKLEKALKLEYRDVEYTEYYPKYSKAVFARLLDDKTVNPTGAEWKDFQKSIEADGLRVSGPADLVDSLDVECPEAEAIIKKAEQEVAKVLKNDKVEVDVVQQKNKHLIEIWVIEDTMDQYNKDNDPDLFAQDYYGGRRFYGGDRYGTYGYHRKW